MRDLVSIKLFEDLNGRFKARLKSSQIKERSFIAREGTVTLTSVVGIFEAEFNMDALLHLEKPCFIATKRADGRGERCLIYEVTAVKPVHYQMLSMSSGMPKVVRQEYLERVDQSWGVAEDTWIDIYSVYTGYVMEADGESVSFERCENIVPLEGSEAKLLSVDAVEAFVNVKGGVSIGLMEGFDRELLVDLERLVKYHGGTFGFTGVGKSNLTSVVVRKVLEKLPEVKVAIVDVAGEYGIGVADQVAKWGAIYTTEDYESAEDMVEAFLSSQAIPETLYESLRQMGLEGSLRTYAEALFQKGKVRPIILETPSLEEMLLELEATGRPEAKSLIIDLKEVLKEGKLPISTVIDRIVRDKELLSKIEGKLEECKEEMEKLRYPPEKFVAQIDYILKALDKFSREIGVRSGVGTPREIASKLIDNEGPERLIVIYIPDTINARLFSAKLIGELFNLRKRKSRGSRVLVVFDEAQEFIPDKVKDEDLTAKANAAVERLLRQGRKYKLHGWISTQRVAHLNVNAIQQVQSFLIGTLPREYDRRVIAEATGISPDILDKTAYLDVGDWLFLSFRATKLKNVPVFIKAENNEEALLKYFTTLPTS